MSIRSVNSIVLFACLVCCASGCHFGRRPCCVDTSVADATAVLHESNKTGEIQSSFDAIESGTENQPLQISQFFGQQSAAIDLQECCCAAAVNSPIADAIDKERKAMCCSGIQNQCVNDFLAGQALMQRNKAASIAGELFLRLVEINLQQELLNESNDRIKELRSASDFASQQGFATVEADNKIDKQEIEIRNQLADLESSNIEVIAKLNAVLGNSLCSPKTIHPIFELFPVYEAVDVCQEIETAFSNRADLAAMNKQQCGCMDTECFSILSKLDPRVGIGVAGAVRKCMLLRKICQLRDPAKCVRKEQFMELKSAREEIVRLQVTEAVLSIQTGYKKLSIENDNVQRLDTRLKALELASQLDSLDAFVNSIEVWGERQKAKSSRISKAIEFEIAKIKLLEATGQWTEICGLSRGNACSCSRGD